MRRRWPLCASIHLTTTAGMAGRLRAATAGLTSERRTRDAPGASGTPSTTQTSRASESADSVARTALQPTGEPAKVPGGVPTERASGVPSMATGSARPASAGGRLHDGEVRGRAVVVPRGRPVTG